MREWDSLIEDQGHLGSCVGNAITNAYELLVRQLYPAKFVELSRLFVYYNSRLLDSAVTEDVGAYLRDGMKAVQKFGICSEQLWPYNIKKFNIKPTDECYKDALSRTITSYQSLQTVDDVLNAVNQNKPVVIGIVIYDSFDRITKGNSIIPIPSDTEKESAGHHAMTIVGYNIPNQLFLVKNSYGKYWGDAGYGWLSFEYVKSEGFEKWVFDISDQTLPIA